MQGHTRNILNAISNAIRPIIDVINAVFGRQNWLYKFDQTVFTKIDEVKVRMSHT